MRVAIATSVLICVLVLTPKADAQDRPERPCDPEKGVRLTCEDAEDLRRSALKGLGYNIQREIARKAEAKKNQCGGALEEARRSGDKCRDRVIDLEIENADLEKRPSWWTVAGAGAAGTAIGIGIGILVLSVL